MGPREERRSPGRPRVAGAPRRPRIRLSCARACAREPSSTRRSSPCRPRPDRHCPWVRGACRGSVPSWPCCSPRPLRSGGSSHIHSSDERGGLMMSGKDEAAIPLGVAPSSPARVRVPDGISPASPQWQQGTAARILPAKPAVKKPWVPKIWIIFAVIGLLLLLTPSIVTFLINLGPGDHSDTGDGSYWLPGLLLLPCLLLGVASVFLALCVGIGEWVAWVWTARQQSVLSVRMFIIPPVVIVAFYFVTRFCVGILSDLGI